jgi:hypothetical protein
MTASVLDPYIAIIRELRAGRLDFHAATAQLDRLAAEQVDHLDPATANFVRGFAAGLACGAVHIEALLPFERHFRRPFKFWRTDDLG